MTSRASQGPTVVLIGGLMTLDSGERVDSRQPMKGDEWDFALRAALGRSERWWEVARQLTGVLLDADEGGADPAWALVWGPKTLWQRKQDGSLKRVRIRSVLPGAVFPSYGHQTIDASETSARYRVLEYPLRFEDLQAARPPTVFVGAHPTEWTPGDLAPFDAVLRKWTETTLVLAHTPLIEAAVSRLRTWFASGRPTPRQHDNGAYLNENDVWVPAPSPADGYYEALRRARYVQPVVVDDEFRITYFLDEGTPGNSADLDASLTFVLSRYDLKVGLWDLARDPGLRKSLLSPEELQTPSSDSIETPPELSRAAVKAKEARLKRRQAERENRRRLHEVIWPILKRQKWQKGKYRGDAYSLAMGNSVQLQGRQGPVPILFFSLVVYKQQSVLSLVAQPFVTGTVEYLRENADGLERVTGQPLDGEAENEVCRFFGQGWDNEAANRREMLDTTTAVVTLLEPTIGTLRSQAEAQYAAYVEEHPLREGPMIIGGDYSDLPLEKLEREQPTLWKKIRALISK